MRLGRIASSFSLAVVLTLWPAHGRAEVLVAPFVGGTFKGQTTLPLFGIATPAPRDFSRSVALGIAGLWLSPGLIGAEAELAHLRRPFERPGSAVESAVVGSSITTLSGSLIVAAPLGVSREGLRPYLAGGLGLLHVGITTVVPSLGGVDRNLLALNLGGGAIGRLNDRVGLRFDLRQTRSVRDDTVPTTAFLASTARARLSYWRASVGVTIGN